MTDREMLVQCQEHFKLLKSFADATGPIRQNGVLIGKSKVISSEAQAAIDGLQSYLSPKPLKP